MSHAEPRSASRRLDRGDCPACGRCTSLTFHHLIPRKVHRRRHYQRSYSRAQLNLGIYLCRLCHDGIHDRFDELTLAKTLSDPQALLQEPTLRSHFDWVARQRRG